MRNRTGPRVVDFSTHFSGPMASQLLAQLGADVVKVENARGGDGNRGHHFKFGDTALLHLALNSGTRSLAITTRSPHWPEVVRGCAQWADIVIVGSQPEAAKKRGLDFESLAGVKQGLVYCLITGYGERGEWRDLPAHGLNLDAFAGQVPIEDGPDGQPAPRADFLSAGTTLAGVHAALGSLAALLRARETGESQYVSVSVWGAAMWWNWRHLVALANLERPWYPYSDLGSRYCLYRTSDGRAIVVCPTEKAFWSRFCDTLGLPEAWKENGRWDELKGMDYGAGNTGEKAQIASVMATKPLNHWVEALRRAEIPFAPILTVGEALVSEHAQATGVLAWTMTARSGGRPARVAAAPVSIRTGADVAADTGGKIERTLAPPPGLGEDTEDFLREIGLEGLIGSL